MTKEISHWLDVAEILLTAKTHDLMELCVLAGALPDTFYKGANLRGADLCGQDVSGLNFEGADLRDITIDIHTVLGPRLNIVDAISTGAQRRVTLSFAENVAASAQTVTDIEQRIAKLIDQPELSADEMFEIGEYYVSMGKFQEAVNFYADRAKINVAALPLLRRLAELMKVHSLVSDRMSYETVLRALISLEEDNLDSTMTLAVHLLDRHEFDLAYDLVLRTALKRSIAQGQGAKVVDFAWALSGHEKRDLAVQLLVRIIEHGATDEQPFRALAYISGYLSDPAELDRAVRLVLRRGSGSRIIADVFSVRRQGPLATANGDQPPTSQQIEIGRILVSSNTYTRHPELLPLASAHLKNHVLRYAAGEYFNWLARQRPTVHQIRMLHDMLWESGDKAEALRVTQAFCDLRSDLVSASKLLADAYLLVHDERQAIDTLRLAIRKFPESPRILRWLVTALLDARRTDEALTAAAGAHHRLGRALQLRLASLQNR